MVYMYMVAGGPVWDPGGDRGDHSGGSLCGQSSDDHYNPGVLRYGQGHYVGLHSDCRQNSDGKPGGGADIAFSWLNHVWPAKEKESSARDRASDKSCRAWNMF